MRFFLIIIYFLIEEIKLNLIRIKFINNFLKQFSIFRYFLYLVNSSIIPTRDKLFRNYIHKNSHKWKNKKNYKNLNNKKYVLVTGIFSNPGYILCEALIGKNLMEILNANGIALLNYYDLRKILLYKSFGIKKIIVLKNSNIFVRLKYFIRSYLIIKSCKNMNEFLNFNINNVDIGKAVYDNYLRFSGMGTTDEFNRSIYVNLSKSLLIYYQIDKYFKKYKIVASVQSEKQFIPGAIIFQTALTNGVNVYSRLGADTAFTVKKYSNINERYTSRGRFSKKLYNLINKNIRKEAIEIGGEIIKKRFENIPEYQVNHDYRLGMVSEFSKEEKIREIEKRNITKEELCKRLEWSPNFPIVGIFSVDLTDGVFDSSWSLFRDKLTWLRETLLKIKTINNVNWLVKSHPNDEKNKVVTSTISEVGKICSNYNHIKLFPSDISFSSIPKFIDAAITVQGSAGNEYPCFGIPAIITSEAVNSGLGYTTEPKSIEEYFSQLQNIKKLKKLNNQQIELAKIFIFIQGKLVEIPSNLIAYYESKNIDEKGYWTEMIKLLDEYKYEEDLLVKMMKIQETDNDMHAINYRMIEKKNLENVFK